MSKDKTITEVLSESVTSNYMLVNVTIRTFGGQRKDKTVTDEIHRAHNASNLTGEYVRKLFGRKNSRLDEVNGAYNALRRFMYQRTLPWTADAAGGAIGDRLLPVSDSLQFIADFNDIRKDAITKRDAMASDLPSIIVQARSTMGNMAPDMSDYPNEAEFKAKFQARMDCCPVPAVSDFSRLSVPAKLAEGLQGIYEQRLTSQITNAKADATERVLTKLDHYSTQLQKEADGGARLYQTLIDNVREANSLFAAVHASDMNHLTQAAAEVTKLVDGVTSIKHFKGNATLSKEYARKAARIVATIKGEATPTYELDKPKAQPVETASSPEDRALAALDELSPTPDDSNLQLSQEIERKIPTSEGGSMSDGDAHLQVDIEEVIAEEVDTTQPEGKSPAFKGMSVSDTPFDPDEFLY